MEFEAIALGENYKISSLNNKTFLISGSNAEYIVYNQGNNWKCADEVDTGLLVRLGNIIESHLHPSH